MHCGRGAYVTGTVFQVPSAFVPILNGTTKRPLIWQDELCGAFLSNRPASTGHALVVPVSEIDEWTDVPKDTMERMLSVSRFIAKAQKLAFPTERIGVVMSGFEVPHCHIHIVPVNHGSELDLARGIQAVEDSDLIEPSNQLLSAMDAVLAGHMGARDSGWA